MEGRGGRRDRRRPAPPVRGGVAVHADRGHPGLPRLRRLLPGRRRGRGLPLVELPGLRRQPGRVPGRRRRRGRRAHSRRRRWQRPHHAVAHRVRHRRLGANVGPAPRLRGALVAAGGDARPRLVGRAARGRLAGSDVPAVPRLGGRVPVREPGVGLADGEDRRGLFPGRLRGAGERYRRRRAGRGAAVVRHGRRRHGLLPGQPGGRAAQVRPRGDVLRRGAVGERGAERDALVRHGVRRGRVRGELPGRRGARQGHRRLPRPLLAVLRQRSARAGLPQRARHPAHPRARVPPGGHPGRRVRDAGGPPGGAAGLAAPPGPYRAHQPRGAHPAGRGPAAGEGGPVRLGPAPAAGLRLPARPGLHLVRLGCVGLHGAALSVAHRAARAGGAAADVQDLAELGQRALRVQHPSIGEHRHPVLPASHVLPQPRPERDQPGHRERVLKARRQVGEGVRPGQLPCRVHGSHRQGVRSQDEPERVETGAKAALLQNNEDEVGHGAGGADTVLQPRRAHHAITCSRHDIAAPYRTESSMSILVVR